MSENIFYKERTPRAIQLEEQTQNMTTTQGMLEEIAGGAICIIALVGIFATTPFWPAVIVIALLMVLA